MADRLTTEELKKLLQLSKAAPEQPWTIRQCYEMGSGEYHWAIENGKSKRENRVIGLEAIFFEHWARAASEVQFIDTPIISYLLAAVNSAPALARELIELRERERWIRNPKEEFMYGIEVIRSERVRQVNVKGWTPSHDMRNCPACAPVVHTVEAAPVHPFEVRISIGGENWPYVIRKLDELHEAAQRGPDRLQGFGGGAGGSYSVTTARRDITPEQYRKELAEWSEKS